MPWTPEEVTSFGHNVRGSIESGCTEMHMLAPFRPIPSFPLFLIPSRNYSGLERSRKDTILNLIVPSRGLFEVSAHSQGQDRHSQLNEERRN